MGVRAAHRHHGDLLGCARHRSRARILEGGRPPKSGADPAAGAAAAAGPEGFGDYDPETGLWEFYHAQTGQQPEGYGWPEILKRWRLIVADLWDRGIDLADPELRRDRTWHWLQIQIEGLLAVPPQLMEQTVPDEKGRPVSRVHAVPQTRLALALQPPDLLTPTGVDQHEED